MRFRSISLLFALIFLCAGLVLFPASRSAAAGAHVSSQDQSIKVGVPARQPLHHRPR